MVKKNGERQRFSDARADGEKIRQATALLEELDWAVAHSRHVARMALQLFDALAPIHGLAARARTILHAAALLHDIGWTILGARHHKHSACLIRSHHARLGAFSRSEVELIAQVARYHRKAEPSERHRPFAVLPVAKQAMVRRLAALLRLADALDRDHLQSVRDCQCRWDGNCVWIQIEKWSGSFGDQAVFARKSLLFKRSFGLDIWLNAPGLQTRYGLPKNTA